MLKMRFDWIFAGLLITLQETICLRILEVVVPGYKTRGESALLQCQYELQGDALYSVKWYKDNEEFYRYLPKFNPPQHSYRVDGVRVDNHMSNDKLVFIKAVTLKSSGQYKCEVSAEAPGFSSASGEGRMEVVFPPKDGPYITGTDREYKIGETLNLNCTSGKSFPASILHWYVNDEKITEPQSLIQYDVTTHQHGLETSTLGLLLVVSTKHAQGGMRTRCVASSPWPSGIDSPGRTAPLTDNREALMFVKSSSSLVSHHIIAYISPVIVAFFSSKNHWNT